MLRANTALVVSIAGRYRAAHLEREDLIQEGMIGLCIAIERYDWARNLRFSTYSTYWIKQRILRALGRHAHLVHVPVNIHYAVRRAEQVREELIVELGREPSSAEIARRCGVSEDRLEAMLASAQAPLSLDAALADDGDPLTLEVADPDAADPEARIVEAENRKELLSALRMLSSRDQLVLESRFGLNGRSLSVQALAERLRITPEAVRQVQRRALVRLKNKLLERTPPAA